MTYASSYEATVSVTRMTKCVEAVIYFIKLHMVLMHRLLVEIQVCVTFGTSMIVFGVCVGGVGLGWACVMFGCHMLVAMMSWCWACLFLNGMTRLNVCEVYKSAYVLVV